MSDRSKFRVWDERLNRYLGKYDPTPMLMSNGNLAYLDDEGMKFYKVEQCTSSKDRNTKLIYDNDIVYDKIDECYKLVYWDNRAYCWALRWNNVCREPLQDGSDLEVIGNIHENKDLLK